MSMKRNTLLNNAGLICLLMGDIDPVTTLQHILHKAMNADSPPPEFADGNYIVVMIRDKNHLTVAPLEVIDDPELPVADNVRETLRRARDERAPGEFIALVDVGPVESVILVQPQDMGHKNLVLSFEGVSQDETDTRVNDDMSEDVHAMLGDAENDIVKSVFEFIKADPLGDPIQSLMLGLSVGRAIQMFIHAFENGTADHMLSSTQVERRYSVSMNAAKYVNLLIKTEDGDDTPVVLTRHPLTLQDVKQDPQDADAITVIQIASRRHQDAPWSADPAIIT